MKVGEALAAHVRKYVYLGDDEASAMLRYFKPLTLLKKQNLIESGQVCKYNFFVEKGCVRMFFIDRKDLEQTTQFAIENWWITDHLSYMNQQRTQFTIQAVEKSEVLAITSLAMENMLRQFPQLERYFRVVYQRNLAATQIRSKYQHDFSKEELFNHFNDNFPEFIQRVPQYLLASYLGLTPEYLSEIRKKNVLKPV